MKKVALITGATSGIGKELAYIHAKNGGDLILVARREKELSQLKIELENEYSISVIIFPKDLSLQGSAKEIFDCVQSEDIEIEYLMNNAGFGLRGEFHTLSLQKQQEMINLNISALTELTYLFLPQLLKKDSAKILNTSSTASYTPGPFQAVYFATKAYVTFLTNALYEELSDTNVTVTNLMPGATDTEFAKIADMDKSKVFTKTVSPRDVAKAGYDGMMAGKLDVVYGLTPIEKMLLWMLPFMPKKLALKNLRSMQEAR